MRELRRLSSVLRLLLDEVRAKTLRILTSVPTEHARWAPARLQNTILWRAGLAFVLVEVLTMKSSAILHGLHDEACHCDEMHLLGKIQAIAKE
jgi:hypothetical protein